MILIGKQNDTIHIPSESVYIHCYLCEIRIGVYMGKSRIEGIVRSELKIAANFRSRGS